MAADQSELQDFLRNAKSSLAETNKKIQDVQQEQSKREEEKETLKKEAGDTKEAAVRDHHMMISEKQSDSTISKALIGLGAGAAAGIIITSTAGLGTPAAIATISSLATAGALTGTAIGLTVEFLQEIFSINPEKWPEYFNENSFKTSLFCFSSGIAFCCAALSRLGVYAYGEVKHILKGEFGKANGIKNFETDENLSKFTDVIYGFTQEYSKNPNKFHMLLQEIEKASLSANIYGLAHTKLSIKLFESALWIERTLDDLKVTLYDLIRAKETLSKNIEKGEELLSKNSQDSSAPQPTQ